MLEANGFAWADVCLTVPGKLRDRDAIAGPSAEVGAALATAAARAASKGGRALAARLQGMMETRTDRKAFIRIGPENAGTAGLPGPPDSRPETPGRKRQRRRAAAEAKEREMTERDTGLRERWSPHGRRGAIGTMGADAILAGAWLSHPVHATREVDLYAAYRALAQEGMADRLFDAGTDDLAASLARHPGIEHLAGVRMTYSDCGTTVTLGQDEPPPADKRHVDQLYAELTLRKDGDPPRTMRVAADIAAIGDRAKDGFVLGRSTGITSEQAADAMMEIFEAELELEAAANGEEQPERLRDTIDEEAVRILEGNDAATLRRLHNAAKRNIEPIMPAGRGAWIEVDADDGIQVGFR